MEETLGGGGLGKTLGETLREKLGAKLGEILEAVLGELYRLTKMEILR